MRTSKNTSYRAEAAVVPHNIYNKLGQPVRTRARERHTRFFKMRDMQPFEYAFVRLWSKASRRDAL